MERINNILIEILEVSEENVFKDLTMNDVDVWDSLTHMNLIVALEEEFKIELSGDEIAEMVSLNSVRNIISKYL